MLSVSLYKIFTANWSVQLFKRLSKPVNLLFLIKIFQFILMFRYVLV